jgi:hypothetical protein
VTQRPVVLMHTHAPETRGTPCRNRPLKHVDNRKRCSITLDGSACSGRRGRRFESSHSDQNSRLGAMSGSERISGFVIAYNRARLLATCLRSLRFVDELIVIDKSSTDDTPRITRRYADRVIRVPWSPTVEETRSLALEQCRMTASPSSTTTRC